MKNWLAAYSAYSLGFTAVALASGCGGPRISNANIDAVNAEYDRSEKAAATRSADIGERAERGVSPKEVESILGVPNKVETFKMEVQTSRPVVDGLRYIYEQDGQHIVLHFVDNKLIAKAPHFGEEAPTPLAEEKKSELPEAPEQQEKPQTQQPTQP